MSKSSWIALLSLLPVACGDDGGGTDEVATTASTLDGTDGAESGTGTRAEPNSP